MKCENPECRSEQVCGGPWCWACRDAALKGVSVRRCGKLNRGESDGPCSEQTLRACGVDPCAEQRD